MAEPVAAKGDGQKTPPRAVPPPLPPRPEHAGSQEPRKWDGGWFLESGVWWMCSFFFHLLLVVAVAIVGSVLPKEAEQAAEKAPAFEEAQLDPTADVPKEIERFDVGETPEDPTELNTNTLTLEKPAQLAQEAEFNDENAAFEHQGGGMKSGKEANAAGLGGFDLKGIGAGPAVQGRGGVGAGVGIGLGPAAAARAGASADAAAAAARPWWPAAAAPSNRSVPWPPP